jgi:hypothetical protein
VDIDNVDTYEETVPNPIRKKHAARILKEDLDGSVMSSGVFPTSAAKTLKPVVKSMEAVKEHAQGPYSSITLPTIAANGQFKKGKRSDKLKSYRSAMVVNCGCVSLRWRARPGESRGKVKIPPARRL